MSEIVFNFEGFIRELQMAGLIRRNPERRRRFTTKYRNELAFVSCYLNDLAVTGGLAALHSHPPEKCDICQRRLEGFGFFIDGQTMDGTQADMCPHCYATAGTGIGWGIGQLYRRTKNDEWLCVAGGDPEAPTEISG